MSESFVTPTDRLNGPSLVHVQFPNNSQQVLQILTTYCFAISDHYRSARLPPNVARFHQYLKCENTPLVHFMDALHFVNAHCVINLNRNPTDEEYNCITASTCLGKCHDQNSQAPRSELHVRIQQLGKHTQARSVRRNALCRKPGTRYGAASKIRAA
jgi:hypothetical protein